MKDTLSVVLVNYNYGSYLVSCLELLEKNKGDLNLDIWVVDNVSSDNSMELAQQKYPKLHYIFNKDNLGFGAGNNVALRKITTEYILLLNPDTEIGPNVLETMLNFMKDHQDVGAATCKGTLGNGQMDWGYHRGFPTPWASFKYYFFRDDSLYHLTMRNMEKTHEVDAISGSFFMTRKSVLDKVGLFDEDYWMYAEDIDLCYRIKRAGYKIIFVPDVIIKHIKGVSSGIKSHTQEVTAATKASRIRAFNSFYETMKTFYRKNLSHQYPFFINWLVYTGINLKWALAKRKMHV